MLRKAVILLLMMVLASPVQSVAMAQIYDDPLENLEKGERIMAPRRDRESRERIALIYAVAIVLAGGEIALGIGLRSRGRKPQQEQEARAGGTSTC